MRITPIDIQQQQFKTRPFGYEKFGVDHFLEMLAEEVERINLENQQLKDELLRTRSALEEMRQREATLKETLLTTQKVTDELKANARKEAELLLTEAQLRGERLVRDAEERRVQLIADIQEIKRQKIAFESSLRALVESHMKLLDIEVVAMTGRERDERLLDEPLPFEQQPRKVLDPGDFEPGQR
jgi:cell division initiation protein